MSLIRTLILQLIFFCVLKVLAAPPNPYIEINSPNEISNYVLNIQVENSTCTGFILNYDEQRYFVTAAHCLPKDLNSETLTVYSNTLAVEEKWPLIGWKTRLKDSTYKNKQKHKLFIKAGLVDTTFDIFVLNLKNNELPNQIAFNLRTNEVLKNENVSIYGYPQSTGPYGSHCDFQSMYIASPSMTLANTRLTAEIFCRDSDFFASFHGMSGGPAVDSDGFVVGIMSSGNPTENAGKKRNYIHIAPSLLLKNILDTKSNNLNKILSFTDYGFSDKNETDFLAQISGYPTGTFIDIEKLGEYPIVSAEFVAQQGTTVLSGIIYSFRKLNLKIELRSSIDNKSSSYSIRRIGDNIEIENGTHGPSLEFFRTIRRWVSKKVEHHLTGQ